MFFAAPRDVHGAERDRPRADVPANTSQLEIQNLADPQPAADHRRSRRLRPQRGYDVVVIRRPYRQRQSPSSRFQPRIRARPPVRAPRSQPLG